jgi:purine-cytosine permease-like protein
MSASKVGNFASWATYTTAYVQYFHAPLNIKVGSQIMFVTSNCFIKFFTNMVAAKMKAGTPTLNFESLKTFTNN